MEKLDQTIKDTSGDYEPKKQFGDEAMQAVMNEQTDPRKKRHGFRLWIPAAAVAMIAAVLIFVLLPNDTKSKSPSVKSGDKVAANNASKTGSAESDTIPAGSSNASLASDLSDVQGAMKQEGSDQSTASAALNDQQHEITVPTE